MTALVEEAVSEGIPVRLFSFNSAEVSMYAIVLPEGSPIVGKRISDTDLPPRTVLTSLLRDGRPLTPSDDDLFESGDELLLLISDTEKNALSTLQALVEVPPAADEEEVESEE